MKNFAIVSVLLLTQTVWKGLCQDPDTCSGSLPASTEKTLPVSQGICNVKFTAEQNKNVKLKFDDYKGTAPNSVFVFDGPNCLTNTFGIITTTLKEATSTSLEMTMLSSYAVNSPATTAFTVKYSSVEPQPGTKTGGTKTTLQKRECGKELTADAGELAAEAKESSKQGSLFCIWNITAQSGGPTKLTVTEFDDTDDANQLWIFDGTDCSGKNLLWFTKFDASKNTVTSQNGKFVLMSYGKKSEKPFVAKWEKGTTPGSSVSIKGSGFWLLLFVGAVRYLETV